MTTELKTFTTEDLKRISEANRLFWVTGGKEGTRADLQGADLQGADLQGAYLQGADLQGAYLRGAYLQGADLQGAYLQGVKIQSCAVFTGLYKYLAMPVIAEDGTEYIRLGCYFQKVSEWAENFWNNPSEFPNSGDAGSKDRWNAYQACLRWLEDHRESR